MRIAQAARVRPRAAHPARVQGHGQGRAAADGDGVVRHLDGRDLGAGRAVEGAAAQGVEHRLAALLHRPHHRPREAAVVARVVRVVGGEPEQPVPALERLVPLLRRIAPAELELAACVPDLHPDEALARLPLLRPQPAPVRVRDVWDAAVAGDPVHHLLERRELVIRDDRVGLDAESEHVGVVLLPAAPGVQLGGRDDEQLPRRTLVRPHPVIGDREDVVPGPFVVAGQQIGGQFAVRVRRVGVQGAPKPDSIPFEHVHGEPAYPPGGEKIW